MAKKTSIKDWVFEVVKLNKISKFLSVENLNRIIIVLSGTFLISLGLYLFLNSHLGLTPFTVMINGLTNTLGLTFGQTSIIFKLTVIISFLLFTDKSFGIGTLINAVFVGLFVDLLTIIFGSFTPELLAVRIFVLSSAIVTVSVGIAIYVSEDMGEGAVEAIMMYVKSKTGFSVKAVRMSLDISFGALGFMLGSSLDPGTLIAAMAIGPVTQRVFGVISKVRSSS